MQPAIPARRVESGRLRAEVQRCRSWQSGGVKTVEHVADSADALYNKCRRGIPCALSYGTQAFVCDKAAETFLNDRWLCDIQTASLTH